MVRSVSFIDIVCYEVLLNTGTAALGDFNQIFQQFSVKTYTSNCKNKYE